MQKKSAGILLYRFINNFMEVFLVHPGGPFWAKKDVGVWSVPKGGFVENENAFDAARRELQEETGIIVAGDFIELTPVTQKSGKIIYCWATHCDADPAKIRSNEFVMEWPPKSGKKKSFPEIDRAAWFTIEEAKAKIIAGQGPLLTELVNKLMNKR